MTCPVASEARTSPICFASFFMSESGTKSSMATSPRRTEGGPSFLLPERVRRVLPSSLRDAAAADSAASRGLDTPEAEPASLS